MLFSTGVHAEHLAVGQSLRAVLPDNFQLANYFYWQFCGANCEVL